MKEAYFLMFLTPCAKAALHKFPSLKKIIHTRFLLRPRSALGYEG
ncbi:MAG: hypothetical protein ACI9X0_002914, partial [Kiritimatiellia bacterium]